MKNERKQDKIGLSEEAKARLEQFIKAYDPINNKALRQNGAGEPKIRDRRLPIPGTVISKVYKGTIIDVKVLDTTRVPGTGYDASSPSKDVL